jgi:hypothetical protein
MFPGCQINPWSFGHTLVLALFIGVEKFQAYSRFVTALRSAGYRLTCPAHSNIQRWDGRWRNSIVHCERNSRADRREYGAAGAHPSAAERDLAVPESRREQRIGERQEAIYGKKAETHYAEEEMSWTNVLTPG